jgi:DNA-binding phage protein
MAKTKISTFDAAKYLDTPELAAEFLNEAFETNDPSISQRRSALPRAPKA